jgi:hypothetical protein
VDHVPVQRFPFRFDPRFVPLLAGMGVVRRTSGVVVDDEYLTARFGLLEVRTPVGNLKDVRITRDYRWSRAIGARLSFTDRGVTFGTNTDAGVCVCFHEPVTALLGDLVRHPGLTMTVEDPEGLAAVLRGRIGPRPAG